MAEQHSQTSDYQNRWKFTGHELDRETGLYYAGARYYDPRVSIWLSVDPLAEIFPTSSPYEYCFSNPVRLFDSTGMYPEFDNEIQGPLTLAQQKALEQYNRNTPFLLRNKSHTDAIENIGGGFMLDGVEVSASRPENQNADLDGISIGLTLGGAGLNFYGSILSNNIANKSNFYLGSFSDFNNVNFNNIKNPTLSSNGINNIHVYDLESVNVLKNVKNVVKVLGYATTVLDGSITITQMVTGDITFARGTYRLIRTGVMASGPIGIIVGTSLYMIEYLYDEHQNNPETTSRLIQYEVQRSFNFDLRTILNGFSIGGGRY